MNGWWLEDELPDELASQLGSDLVYEVDSNALAKEETEPLNTKTTIYCGMIYLNW